MPVRLNLYLNLKSIELLERITAYEIYVGQNVFIAGHVLVDR